MALDPTMRRDLFERVAAGDGAWVKERFDAGDLDGLREHLDASTWRELPQRLEAGDVPWLRIALGSVPSPDGADAADAAVRVDSAHLEHVRDVRAHLAAGDVSWLRSSYRTGQLDWLQDHLDPGDWTEMARRLDAGDVGWVRRVLGGVVVPGVGLLGASERVTDGPVTWTPPKESADKRRVGWLLPTGAVVLVLALLALLLSQCDSGGSGTAPTTVPTTPSPTIATTTTAAPTTTVAAATTTVPPTTVAGSVDLVATVTGTPTFSTLTKALAAAGLADTLKGAGPFTLFAPSDAAFAKLPAGTLEALLKSKDDLAKVLTYHVVAGRLTGGSLAAGELKTLEGDSLTVSLANNRVLVNDATVLATDIATSNGVIHTIDTVLLPPGFTAPGASAAVATGDVFEALQGDERFSTLVKALGAAGLTGTLQGKGPFTVFAPTNAAFAALGDGVADQLLADRATLTKVLTYHVVAGKLTSDVMKIGPVRTVAGGNLTVGVTNGKVSVNDAKVVTADVPATNGVVHVIDKVLVPEGVDLAKVTASPTTSTTAPPATTTTAPPATTTTTAASTPPVTSGPTGTLAWVVYFDSDSSTIRADAAAVLRDAAARIPNGAKVSLVGVADTRGPVDANEKLSADRAREVQRVLENAGVKATFTITGKGAEANSDLQKARRVEISVS